MRKTLTSLAPSSDTREVAFLAKADISFATKSGHFNLLRTMVAGSMALQVEGLEDEQGCY